MSSTASACSRSGIRRQAGIVGGAVGCEHASIFTALDAKVTLIEGVDRLLGYVDAEPSDDLRRIFESMGMDVALDDGQRGSGRGRLLSASGHSGNTEGLGLEQVDVEVDSQGRIIVDDC